MDIDGTIADITHRFHHIKNNDFNSFFAEMHKDKPKQDMLKIMDNISSSFAIILLTGRPDKYRKVTTDWLRDNFVSYNKLIMRKTNDYRPDFKVKKELYYDNVEPFYKVNMVFEDRGRVVEMWRKLGLTCAHIALDLEHDEVIDKLFGDKNE